MTKLSLLLITLVAIPAWASTPAGLLRDKCQTAVHEMDSESPDFSSAQAEIDTNYCVGFVAGWGESSDESFFVGEDHKLWQMRFDDGVTVEQVVKIFVKFVNEHPELENQTADRVLLKSLIRADVMHKHDTGLTTWRPEDLLGKKPKS